MLSAALVAACDATVSGSPLPSNTPGSSHLPATTATPTRPKDIDLTNLSPCAAIPKTDYPKLHITGDGTLHSDSPFPNSRSCGWLGDTDFGVYYVAGEGIEAWKDGSRQGSIAPIDPILGYPVYRLDPPIASNGCDLLVDVHDGQYFTVDITPMPDGDPLALAREVTESILTNLTQG